MFVGTCPKNAFLGWKIKRGRERLTNSYHHYAHLLCHFPSFLHIFDPSKLTIRDLGQSTYKTRVSNKIGEEETLLKLSGVQMIKTKVGCSVFLVYKESLLPWMYAYHVRVRLLKFVVSCIRAFYQCFSSWAY